MEFKQLEAFVAVVEYSSFSKAAKHLYLTQPTISAHIRALEQELNSRLIIRTTKKLTVTDRGYQLYDCAVHMLSMRNNLISEFTGKNTKIIDLGVSTIPSSYILPEILSAFGKKYTNVYFHSWQSDSQGAISKVLDGSVDLCLVGNRIEDERLCFLPFFQDELVLAAPVNDHFLKLSKENADLSQLLNEPFIMRESGSGTKKEIDRYLESQGILPSSLRVIAQMNDLEAIKKSIVNGLGVSILSACSVKDLAHSRQILLFPLEKSHPSRTFYLAYSKERILKPHVKDFLNFTLNFFHQGGTP